MTTQVELEAALQKNEDERAKLRDDLAAERRDMQAFGILVRGWVKKIEDQTIDWDELIDRLDLARKVAEEHRDGKT